MTASPPKQEHREFERFYIDFSIKVSGISDDGEFCEDATLRDISGGGLCFVTAQQSDYRVGESITLTICLPGTDALEAGMECKGLVVWKQFSDSTDADGNRQAFIGVCLDGFMSFESNGLQEPVRKE